MKYLQRHEWLTLKKKLEDSPDPIDTIILVALETGGRACELVNLKASDFDFQQGRVSITAAKNSKNRKAKVSAKILKKVKSLSTGPDILSHGTKAAKTDARRVIVDRRLKAICAELGLPRLGLHALRHTLCSQLYVATGDVLLVKDFIGHRSINSTMAYMHMTNTSKAEAQLKNLFA